MIKIFAAAGACLLMLTDTLSAAEHSRKDPRMEDPAVIMAYVCTPSTQGSYCREVYIDGPEITEYFGSVDQAVPVKYKLNLRACNIYTRIHRKTIMAKARKKTSLMT